MRLSQEVLDDLARSGLTAEDAERLRLEDVNPLNVHDLVHFRPRPAYKISYFDLDGNLTEFFRLRFLDKEKPKYAQPPGTVPRLYLAPYTNWREIAEDSKRPIIITEGEKSAAAPTKEGAATIGLGGVWAFKSKKTGAIDLIPDFDKFNLKDRFVMIVFDSDIAEKPQVLGALHAFAYALSSRGAKPSTVMLPHGDNGEKTALDDFIVRRGAAALIEVLKERKSFDELKVLWDLNTKYAVLINPASIYQFARGETDDQLLTVERLTKILAADVTMGWCDAEGEIKTVPAAPKWLAWPMRRKYTKLAYEPGQPTEMANGAYNLWRGLGAPSIEGDVSLWNQGLDHVFASAPSDREWVERWLAYPIQHPGTKLFTAVMLWGAQGAGKSILAEAIGQVYGENFREISEKDLKGSFNHWAKHKQFILANEISGSDKRPDANKLKNLITQSELHINTKFQPQYTLPDRMNFWFTSNHPDAAWLDNDDRRFFVHEITSKMPIELGNAISDWMKSSAGASALRWHLEHVDLGDFDPKAPAPRNAAKDDMIEAGRSDLERWAHDIKEDPMILRVNADAPDADLYSIEHLVGACEVVVTRRPTSHALSNALRTAGLRQTRPFKTKRGTKRLWVIRNPEKWQRASDEEIIAHWNHASKSVKY